MAPAPSFCQDELMSDFSIEDFLRQVMKGADDTYRQKDPISGMGFVVGEKSLVSDEARRTCALLPVTKPITSLSQLRRFAAVVRKAVKASEAQTAGVLCELPVSLDGSEPEVSILLYVDHKYGGMRVYIAPKAGEHLLFRDLGVANPGMNFLPSLIPIESYGAVVAEA